MRQWRHLKGKPVVVTAGGVEYRGTVVELGEAALVLRASAGHREIPWASVTRIREDAGRTGGTRLRGPSALG